MKNEINKSRRLSRERLTIEKMVYIYCRENHGFNKKLCIDCSGLLKYSEARLIYCPFGENKPVCSNCSIHCYSVHMREKIKSVMRFSGPRMIFEHPYLAIMHIIDEKIIKPLIVYSKSS